MYVEPLNPTMGCSFSSELRTEGKNFPDTIEAFQWREGFLVYILIFAALVLFLFRFLPYPRHKKRRHKRISHAPIHKRV